MSQIPVEIRSQSLNPKPQRMVFAIFSSVSARKCSSILSAVWGWHTLASTPAAWDRPVSKCPKKYSLGPRGYWRYPGTKHRYLDIFTIFFRTFGTISNLCLKYKYTEHQQHTVKRTKKHSHSPPLFFGRGRRQDLGICLAGQWCFFWAPRFLSLPPWLGKHSWNLKQQRKCNFKIQRTWGRHKRILLWGDWGICPWISVTLSSLDVMKNSNHTTNAISCTPLLNLENGFLCISWCAQIWCWSISCGNVSMMSCSKMGAAQNHGCFFCRRIDTYLWAGYLPALHAHARISFFPSMPPTVSSIVALNPVFPCRHALRSLPCIATGRLEDVGFWPPPSRSGAIWTRS